jgi:hypothetical protein
MLHALTCDQSSWIGLFSWADRLFYLGNTPIWLIVKKLKLTEQQQWECRLLKSLPAKRRADGLDKSAQRIYGKLMESLPSIMRTMPKGDDCERRAHEIIRRRKHLWVCAEIAAWQPTETARLYRLMTGETLTKSQTANQLAAIAGHRRKRKRSSVTTDDE